MLAPAAHAAAAAGMSCPLARAPHFTRPSLAADDWARRKLTKLALEPTWSLDSFRAHSIERRETDVTRETTSINNCPWQMGVGRYGPIMAPGQIDFIHSIANC